MSAENKNNNSLEKAWKLVNFCEFDKYAATSYCAIHNVDDSLNLGDITKVDEARLESFNMICGGSPCQDFSVAGKQKGSVWTCADCHHEYNPLTVHWTKRDKCPRCKSTNIEKTRSSLLVEYLRMIRANRPNFGVYENVKNIVGKQFKDTFKMFTDELNEYGYTVYWKVLNAKNYGIPQNRERVYVIFIKKDLDNGKFKFPEPFDNGVRLKDVLEDEVDEKFYISDDKVQKFLKNFSSNLDTVTTRNSNIANCIRSSYYKNGSRNIVQNIETGGGYEGIVEHKETKDVNLPHFIGNVNRADFGTGYAGGVWDTNNISPTLTTMQDGGRQPKILQGIDKSLNQTKCIDVANFLTTREDRGISNRKSEGTAVMEYVDHTVLLTKCGECFEKQTEYANTLLARDYKGFGNQPMNAVIKIPQATKKGYIECEIGGVADLSYPESKTRRGRVQDGGNISTTITATETGVCRIEKCIVASCGRNPQNPSDRTTGSPTEQRLEFNTQGTTNTLTSVQKDNYVFEPTIEKIRIRKLTPKECFRLMGFSDTNFNSAAKVVSNSQLYKQAGNSIVVDVLYYIFVELYKAMPYLFEDLRLSSFFSGIGAFEVALDRLYTNINSGAITN